MANPFLQTHYRRGATDLSAEQIEEIRHLKNKVPTYMIVRDYHICKERVYDIWNNSERSQQSKNMNWQKFLVQTKKQNFVSLIHLQYTSRLIRANRRISRKRKHRGLSLFVFLMIHQK